MAFGGILGTWCRAAPRPRPARRAAAPGAAGVGPPRPRPRQRPPSRSARRDRPGSESTSSATGAVIGASRRRSMPPPRRSRAGRRPALCSDRPRAPPARGHRAPPAGARPKHRRGTGRLDADALGDAGERQRHRALDGPAHVDLEGGVHLGIAVAQRHAHALRDELGHRRLDTALRAPALGVLRLDRSTRARYSRSGSFTSPAAGDGGAASEQEERRQWPASEPLLLLPRGLTRMASGPRLPVSALQRACTSALLPGAAKYAARRVAAAGRPPAR